MLLCCVFLGVFAQNGQIPFPTRQLLPATSSLIYQHNNGGNRAATKISVDYVNLEYLRNPSQVFYLTWPVNNRFLLNIPPSVPSDTLDLYTARWVSVKFDSIVDTDNDVSYNKATFTSLIVDSLTFTAAHRNLSGQNDTLFLTIYEAAATPTGFTFQTGTGNNLNYTPNNTVLWRDTLVFNVSLTANVNTPETFILPVRTPSGGAVTVPQGKGFVVKLDYTGPEQDTFNIADFNRFPCGTSSTAAPAQIPNNTGRWFNLWINNSQDFRGINPLTLTNQPAGCQNYFFQNVAIGAVVIFDTQPTTSCPGPVTGTPGFRPDYNSLACINQSTAYTGNVTFEVPSSVSLPPSVTINSIRIDSITNLPCGITYSLDRVNRTYNGGQTGCVTFSGTTTSPVGAYKLRIYATVNSSAGTMPMEISSFGGFEYYLRVIANGASACSTVTSGSTGLTANCNPTTPLSVTVSSNANGNTICRGATAQLTATATGGTSPYTYSWSASTGAAPTAVSNPNVSPTATTTYTVTVTATGGATATGSITITVNAPPSATISGNTTFCSGGNTQLSAPAGLSYQWSANAGNSTSQTVTVNQAGTYSVTTTQNGCTATSSVTVSVGNPTATITPNGPTTFCQGGNVVLSAPAGFTYTWSSNAGSSTNQTVTVTQGGTYSVTVSAGAGCTATSSVSVTVNTAPSATITPNGPTTFCSGGSVTLSAPAGLTYLWSSNAGSSTNQSITATQSGTYSVTTTQNGCTATSSVTITVNNGPSATITPSGATTFCTGGSVTLSAPAGFTYTWSANAGNSTNQSVTATQAGTYSVTVSNGSCTATSSVTVNVVSSPSATITPSGATTFCAGGSLTLSAPSGYNYTWSSNAGNATSQTVSVTQSGTYNVTVSAGASCTATSSITVTVNTPPTVSISASGPTTFCTGGSVTLTASSGQSYLWGNGSTNSSLVASQNGTYSVTVTSANGCTGTASQVVTVVSTPSATITPSGPTTVCPGVSVTLTAPSGYTYAWSNGSAADNISVTLPGTYSVTVSAGASCTATSNITIANHAAPSAVVTPAGPVTVCAGETVTLSAPAGLTYLWSNGSNTQSISPTLAGNYTVTVTNANNCTAVSTPVQVNAVNPPAAPTVTFSNGTLSTTATASSYQWHLNGNAINGATSQNYTPTQNGNYTLVITDATGCSSQSTNTSVTGVGIFNVVNNMTVTINPNPSTGMFFISTGNYTGTFTLTVLDMAGREVMTQTVNGQLQQYPLDLSNVGDGVYIVRLSNGNAVNHSRVIVY